MNRELGLRVLSEIMGWDNEQSRKEFRWLTFMSSYKYDGYNDYLAGARFIESLATWLQQFSFKDRSTAYTFVKQKLIYFSPPEIQRLVEKFFPEHVQQDLVSAVSNNLGIPTYEVWSTKKSIEDYRWERRKILFMGLSDGAHIDILRRANVGTISNEQIVIATQIDDYKWESLLKDLRSDLYKIRPGNTQHEKFSRVYLIDDFTASGTSLLRPDTKNTGKYTGKLIKFAKSLSNANKKLGVKSLFSENFVISIHHYICTEKAKKNTERVYKEAASILECYGLRNIKFTYGMLLSSSISLFEKSSDPFVALCKKYYNSELEGDGEHGSQSGTTDKMFGYANCGLPVVLEHNTPNNSLPLIWADVDIENGQHKMRPLFRRRERHSDMGGSD